MTVRQSGTVQRCLTRQEYAICEAIVVTLASTSDSTLMAILKHQALYQTTPLGWTS